LRNHLRVIRNTWVSKNTELTVKNESKVVYPEFHRRI
jgi:hypothetical protein